MLDILGIRLAADLSAIEPGSLIVANHISWVDVFVLNAARPVAFVSKSEVRRWPLVGWLAARTDTVFLRRGSRGHAKVVNAEIDALLNTGKDVALFPEGTTTDGTHMLGFHSALLQPAVETGRPIQPVALSYQGNNGLRSVAPAYAGETTLMGSLHAILNTRGITAQAVALPALTPVGRHRRELAHMARERIATSIGV
ncbi:MAG TPA: lysophospholipid acyltransferase family protein [Azospira sp.]|nr:lysophospholipid acyltransferase family protein [Azospira sp.]